MPGLTPAIGACFAEAACVCLEEQTHHSGVNMSIDGECVHKLAILWNNQGYSDQRLRAWGDPDVATEQGAYGVAALLVDKLTDFTVVNRARKGKGFDYWLGKKDSPDVLLQGCARLEVSGIRKGKMATLSARTKQKIQQITPSDGPLPGIVVVVEFGTPRARVVVK